MPSAPEIKTPEHCVEQLRAVLACLDKLATEPDKNTGGSVAVAAIHVQQAIELIKAL